MSPREIQPPAVDRDEAEDALTSVAEQITTALGALDDGAVICPVCGARKPHDQTDFKMAEQLRSAQEKVQKVLGQLRRENE